MAPNLLIDAENNLRMTRNRNDLEEESLGYISPAGAFCGVCGTSWAS